MKLPHFFGARNQSIISAILTASLGLFTIYLISLLSLPSENSFLFLITSSTLFLTVYQNISFTLSLPFYPLLETGQSISAYRRSVIQPLLSLSLIILASLVILLFSVDINSSQFLFLYSRPFTLLLLSNYILSAVLPFSFLKSFYYGRFLESSLINYVPPLSLSIFLLVAHQPSPTHFALVSLISRIILLIYSFVFIRPLQPLPELRPLPTHPPLLQPRISASTTFIFLGANLVFLSVSFITESYIALFPSTVYLLTTISFRLFFLPSSLFIEPYLQTYRRQLVKLSSLQLSPIAQLNKLIKRTLLVSLFFYSILIIALPSLSSLYLSSVNLYTQNNLDYLYIMTLIMLPALPFWSIFGVLSRYLESSAIVIKPSVYGSVCYLLYLASLVLFAKSTVVFSVPLARLLLYGLLFPIQAIVLSFSKLRSLSFLPIPNTRQNISLLIGILASLIATLVSLYMYNYRLFIYPVA